MKYYAIDTETARLEAKLDASVPIWCASFAYREGQFIRSTALPWNAAKQELLSLIADEDVTFIIHNAAFDIPVLRLRGVDIPPGRYIDTMVMSYVVEPGGDHSLKDWGVKLGDYKGEFNDFENGLTDEMLEYAEQDARVALKVYETLKPLLEEDEQALELYLDVELPYVEVIIEMESTGFYIDRERLPEVRRDVCRRKDVEMESIRTLVPYVPGKTIEYKRKTPEGFGYYQRAKNEPIQYERCELLPFNPNSDKQLAFILQRDGWKPTEFTPTGAPKMAAQILEDLDSRQFPYIEPILEWSALDKIDGTFLEAFAELSDEHSILHGSFNQAVTLTGRLSSSKP